ncbi:hypothetical protein, partial [Actinocorallia lasiicapitis]
PSHLQDQNNEKSTLTWANALTHWHCRPGALFSFQRPDWSNSPRKREANVQSVALAKNASLQVIEKATQQWIS